MYAVGLKRALTKWRPWLSACGSVAFSDFVLWTGDLSEEAREFWAVEYPEMASQAEVGSCAKAAGYRPVVSFRMLKEAHDDYYVPLEARVDELSGSVDAEIQQVLAGLRREIDVVR